MVTLLVGLLLVFPSQAHADGFVSFNIGSVFGGSTGSELVEAVENSATTTYGLNFGGMGSGVFGAEFDFGYTPRFFGSDSGIESSGVMTMMGSLIIGIPIGGQSGAGIRPYGVFGVGLIRRRIEFRQVFDNISSNDFGYNFGFGVMGFFTDVFGLRGEYRYFRNSGTEEEGFPFFGQGTFNFSRASLGIVLRF
jgi:opacity protein-like surface antigen